MASATSPSGHSVAKERMNSPRSFSSRRSSSGSGSSFESCNDVIAAVTSSPDQKVSTIRRCNRYGWFVESEEGQDLETPLSPEKLMNRESKWIEMTASDKKWCRWIEKKFRIVRSRCRKGIPHSVRGRGWLYLSGAHRRLASDSNLFQQLDSAPGNENINEEIRRDLHRQFPSHEMFATQNGSGQQDLYRVLKACSILKPKVGYCQGQAPLAAVLLMVMPAEHAFWTLAQLCDHYVNGYFDPGLETVQLHGDMLYALLRTFHPSAHRILKKQKIEPVLYMTEWFMCLFSRTLPWPLVLRVWDMFMCEGIIVIFKVAIVLIGTVLEGEKKSCKAMYETLQVLKNPPKKYLQEKGLLTRVIRLELTAADLKREHAIQYNARKIKRSLEEKRRQSVQNNRRQDSLNRSIKELKVEKTPDDKSQHRVNGHKSSPPDSNGGNVYTSYTKEPTSGTRSHRRTSSEVRSVTTVKGDWVENEVRNRRSKRTDGRESRGNSR